MVLFGAVINALLIIIGSMIGRLFHNIPEKMKETVMSIIGLAVAVLGIQMGLTSNNFIIVIISLVVGAMLGEWMDLDRLFQKLGKKIESFFGPANNGKIAEGFVTASLIFVVGSMAIIGALDSGLRNDHTVLITKGFIDGFTAIFLTSTLGMGVLLSFVPVLFYQSIIAISASFISTYIPTEVLDSFIQEMTATGGIMIVAIGLNIMGLVKIRVANLLPGIVVVGVIVVGLFWFR